MPTASEPIFPPEILDCIIDQVSKDRKMLIEWSLVCRDWAGACRRRLFSEVALSPESWKVIRNSDAHLYARAVILTCPSPVDKVKTVTEAIAIPKLLVFFLSKWPLKLVQFLLPAPIMDKLLSVDPVSQFNDEMMQRLFPNVTFLHVKFRPTGEWRERQKHYDLLRALPNIVPHVTILELFDLFGTFYETVQFVCSFPELETLALSFVERHDLKGDVDHFLLPVGLKTIILRHHECEAECLHFVEWLSAIKPTPQLISFTFVKFSPTIIEPLSRLSLKLGNSLQYLRLIFDFRPSNLLSFLLPTNVT